MMAITTSNSINVKAALREEFALIFKSSPDGLRSNTRLIVGMTGLPVNHREYEMNAFSKLQRRHRAQGLARASIRVKKTYKLS